MPVKKPAWQPCKYSKKVSNYNLNHSTTSHCSRTTAKESGYSVRQFKDCFFVLFFGARTILLLPLSLDKANGTEPIGEALYLTVVLLTQENLLLPLKIEEGERKRLYKKKKKREEGSPWGVHFQRIEGDFYFMFFYLKVKGKCLFITVFYRWLQKLI